MKTKLTLIVLNICLINSLTGISQTVDNKPDTIQSHSPSINNSATYRVDTIDFRHVLQNDSIGQKKLHNEESVFQSTDSLKPTSKKEKKESIITSKIEYNAVDSTVYSMDGQKVFLFGKAEVKYEDITLTAAYIEADMQNGIIYAEGGTDSIGNVIDEPLFVQGTQEIKAKTITYNLKTEKGYIKGLYTQQDDGYLHSQQTKKEPDNSINLNHGKYTTCELEHPHFYLWISRGKVVPGKAIVSSYAFLVVEDVPLYPLMIPFGFFPSSKERASGFIIPKIGEENNRGFYLRDGGYYFALSQYADLTLKGDVYSKGSWQAQASSSYKKRYKFSGSFNLAYSKVLLNAGSINESESFQYKVAWTHSQDAKARPNSKFSANVNFSSSGQSKYNSSSSEDYLTNTTSSSISYNKTFANTPFSMSMTLKHSQNTTDSSYTFTLPQLTLTMSRIYPFQKKVSVGETKWYEKIGFTYTGNFQNQSAKIKDTVLFTDQMWDYFSYGAKHSVPLSTSMKVFKYFNLSPGMSFVDRMYFKKDIREYDPDTTTYETKTENGLFNVYDYNYSVGLGTTLYGMFQFKHGWIKAIRHVATPSVSLSYRPDFSQEKYGFYIADENESAGYYNPFAEYDIYGMPGTGKSGSVSFSLSNNLEMKVTDPTDTVSGTKKIKLIESLSLSTGYNMIADSLNWSVVNISGRTTLFKGLSINASAVADLYGINDDGDRINRFERDISGKLARLTSVTASTGYSFKSTDFTKKDDKDSNKDGDGDKPKPKPSNNYDDTYDYFDIPWDLKISYSLNYSKATFTPTITQTLNFSGNFSLTPKWKIGFRSGWDFEASDFSYTSFNISRDLHCWAASVSIVPFGERQSYSFTIGVKSAILQDLKYDKSKTWIDNYAY